MSLKVIEEIDRLVRAVRDQQIGHLLHPCWPDIKAYIDTVEEILEFNNLGLRNTYFRSELGMAEQKQMEEKLNEIRKRLGAE